MSEDRSLTGDLLADGADLHLTRRDFLKVTGGGIFVFFVVRDSMLYGQERMTRPSLPTDFNAFLKIGEDGRVSCYTGKIEMGQGVYTSLAQELAEELDVPLDSVDMVMGDTDLCPWDMGTFGSMSTRFFGPALRAAGAEARQVLVDLAAERLKTPAEKLITENGVVYAKADRSVHVTYAELTKGKKIERHVSHQAPLKKRSQFKVISHPTERRDARQKVAGEAKYAGDIRLPGMLYAKILRPPAHGAKLLDADVSEANKVEGARVIRDGDLVVTLHARPDVAELALSKVKATFSPSPLTADDKTIFDHLLKVASEGKTVAETGNLKNGEKTSASVFESTYLNDYVAHAPIEPHTAIAHVEPTRATVWASTQAPFRARDEVAREVGLSPKNVRVITPFVGGGFGGKTRNLQVVEAARISKLCGKPVQVAWTRAEEFFYDSFRPAAIVKIRSGIDGAGRMSFWDYHVYYAGERGAQQFYTIPNSSTVTHGAGWEGPQGSHPFATGAWRAPSNNTNTFARESQIDIMASRAKVDPVEFRLRHLGDRKMERVLKAAAEKFGWTPSPSPSGRGYGVACGTDAGTTVAACAEVEVRRDTGEIRVKRVVCAQDMGLVINPEGARIQMEGCITMGLGYALREGLHFTGGKILDTNFDTYAIPRFSWLPEIDTILIDNPDEDPQGGGEPSIITMGGVIANAVFDAAGARMYQLPMTPERVKAALAAKG